VGGERLDRLIFLDEEHAIFGAKPLNVGRVERCGVALDGAAEHLLDVVPATLFAGDFLRKPSAALIKNYVIARRRGGLRGSSREKAGAEQAQRKRCRST
jgi:hypothetical protein